jgi:hypothetical protein
MRLHASWKRFWDRAVRLCASPLLCGPCSFPHEIGLRLSYINADGAARLTAKLATQSPHSKKRGSTRTRVKSRTRIFEFDWGVGESLPFQIDASYPISAGAYFSCGGMSRQHGVEATLPSAP